MVPRLIGDFALSPSDTLNGRRKSPLHRVGTASLAVCLTMSAIGCGRVPRVALEAPSPDASIEIRTQAYHSLRPTGGASYSTGGRELFLASGTTIRHPGDLLAVVPKDSQTAQAARAFEAQHRRARRARIAENSLSTATMIMASLGFGTAFAERSSSRPYFVASGALLAGWFAAMLARRLFSEKSDQLAKKAYAHYEDDLVKHLRIPESKGILLIRDTKGDDLASRGGSRFQLSKDQLQNAPKPSLSLVRR